ncbi:MAG: reprolysin-like metallopeptidase, partial [Acidobacteriota bacterium]
MNREIISGRKNLSRTTAGKQTVLWQQVSEALVKSADYGLPEPEKYLVFRLNKTSLSKLLASAPSEIEKALPENPVIMELPMPDGSFVRFQIEESSVLEPDLAAKFPEIKSYRGQGIDDPTLTTRFDWTPQGFHALILSGGQTINLEPANTGDASLYISYYGDDLKKGKYECLVKDFHNLKPELPQIDAPQIAVGSTLRKYRIAIATTYEYAQAYGSGTVAGTVSSLNTWLNGANLIYERELSIHLNLVNNTSVIYSADRGFTSATDPYNNSDVGSMLSTVFSDLYNNVGDANYDLGHAMGYLGGGASGVAYVGVACSGFKAGGATLMGGPAGNSGTLGVWVHELGHEFGADHNYNGTQGFCGGSRSNLMSYESGGGSTIMAYPQICGTDDIAYSRDMRFHAMSYAAINNYINSASCSVNTATNNSAPIVSGGGNHNIPKNTPFILTATGSDPNGDVLTYTWEQIDAGGASYPQNGTSASYNDAGDLSSTTRPIFRPFPASTSPSRTFPSLAYILDYANDPPDTDLYGFKVAEELPRVGRTLNFRVTARDNRTGGGGVNEDTVTLAVDNNSGPLLVTSPNTNVSFSGNTAQTITWSVNNTNAAPVNATNVKISLSTDGGNTFPTVLAASTPNDGSQAVTIPNISTTTARIKVEAVNNVFFDISNTNFSITAGTGGAQGIEADVAGRFTG